MAAHIRDNSATIISLVVLAFVLVYVNRIIASCNPLLAQAAISQGAVVAQPSSQEMPQNTPMHHFSKVTVQANPTTELEQICAQKQVLRVIADENRRQLVALQAEREQIRRLQEQAAQDQKRIAQQFIVVSSAAMPTPTANKGTGTIEVNYGGDQSLRTVIEDESGIEVIIIGAIPNPPPPNISTENKASTRALNLGIA
jgi:hypothetical protein